MHITIITIILLLTLAVFLRGGKLHNYLVLESENILQGKGFETYQEHPEKLPDGSIDYIDLLAKREGFLVCIEVETSARYVLTNVAKAEQLGLPLVIVVPNRKVKTSIQNKLNKPKISSGRSPVYVLLLAQLEQEVTNCFPLFSPANEGRKNKKTNQIKDSENAD